MILEYTVTVLISAGLYFYYNWQFCRFAELTVEGISFRRGEILVISMVNYCFFMLVSMLGLHLVINWGLFFLLLFGELVLIYHGNVKKCFGTALIGAVIGLTVNLFARNLMAVIMHAPLASFDNNTTSATNYKAYPVIIGFLLSGMAFQRFCNTDFKDKIRDIFQDKMNLNFFLSLMIIIYGNLCLNLFLYYTGGDLLILKLWGIKTCIFVLLGVYLAVIYSSRLSQINRYRLENRKTRTELEVQKEKEKYLASIMYTDPLTGCRNYQYMDHVVTGAINRKEEFCLCFIDLNGLKIVNDTAGHQEGNRYLIAVVSAVLDVFSLSEEALYRYGGDEFSMILPGTDCQEAVRMSKEVNRRLTALSNTAEYPFSMSISFGLVRSEEGSSVEALVQLADQRMYEDKKRWKDSDKKSTV